MNVEALKAEARGHRLNIANLSSELAELQAVQRSTLASKANAESRLREAQADNGIDHHAIEQRKRLAQDEIERADGALKRVNDHIKATEAALGRARGDLGVVVRQSLPDAIRKAALEELKGTPAFATFAGACKLLGLDRESVTLSTDTPEAAAEAERLRREFSVLTGGAA